MKAIKEEFPNPVLSNDRDDYIESCSFQTSFSEKSITVDEEFIVIPIKYDLNCNGLAKLIEIGDAVVVVKAKSSGVSFSALYRFPAGSEEMNIKIPKYSVVKRIDIEGSIIASKDIKEFRCEGEFNDLYFGTATFEIRKGDVLANEAVRTIYLDDTELEKPLASIFNISCNEEQEYDVMPAFDDDKIEVRLKKELYDLYYEFKDFNNGTLRRYAASVVVYPVLVEAVGYIIAYYQDDGEYSGAADYSEKRWFRAIEHKAGIKGIDFSNCQESPTTLANDLLGDIALDALKSFKDTLEIEVNSGETELIGGVD